MKMIFSNIVKFIATIVVSLSLSFGIATTVAVAGNVKQGTEWCTSSNKTDADLYNGPAQGNHAKWEGIFDCAVWNGGNWTAHVGIGANETLTRNFAHCKLQPYHGQNNLFCHTQVNGDTAIASPAMDSEPDANDNAGACHLSSTGSVTESDLARKPSGWQGIFKCAVKNGNTWSATTSSGESYDYGVCVYNPDQPNKKQVICQ